MPGWNRKGGTSHHFRRALGRGCGRGGASGSGGGAEFQPIRINQTLKPKTVTNPKPGVYVFDLGQNMVGWARLKVAGRQAPRFKSASEKSSNRMASSIPRNLRTARLLIPTFCAGKELNPSSLTSPSTVSVTSNSPAYPGTPTRDAVEGIVFYTAAPFTIQFKTANETVNHCGATFCGASAVTF